MFGIVREIARLILIRMRSSYFKFLGYSVDKTARISFSAYLDKTNPKGIVIGEYSLVARDAAILSHDFTRSFRGITKIGKYYLIGTKAIVLPGIEIGDHCVIGAGAVVTKNVPPNSLVVGNPAKVIRTINTDRYGRIIVQAD